MAQNPQIAMGVSRSAIEECPSLQLIYIQPYSDAMHMICNASYQNAKLVPEVSFRIWVLHVCVRIEPDKYKFVRE